jgi:hypothetical protein
MYPVIRKEIPRSDVSLERRQELKDERSSEYASIEVLDGVGSLSAGADEPTDNTLWGDPVNLVYPLAGSGDSEPSRERANNARTRFKQFATDQYDDESSLRFIHERIVRAQILAGAFPAFDPDDSLDALLPSDLQEKMVKKMSELEKALADARELISPSEPSEPSGPTLRSVVDEINAIRGLVRPELAKRVSTLALSLVTVVNKEFAGDPIDPADFGLPFLDVSGDENYSPYVSPLVTINEQNQTRSLIDPLAEPVMVDANDDMVQRTGPSPDASYPGPLVPHAYVDMNAPLRIPEGPRPTGAPWEPAGVAKSSGLPFGRDRQ